MAAVAAAQTPYKASDAAQAAQFEQTLKEHPDQYALRAALLRYYFSATDMDVNALQEARRRHILWLVANHPEAPIFSDGAGELGTRLADPEGYAQWRELWRQQGSKDDTAPITIARAARVLALADPDTAAQMFAKGRQRFPHDSDVAEMEGVLDAYLWTGVTALLSPGFEMGLGRPELQPPPSAFDRPSAVSPEARHAEEELTSTSNTDILRGAALTLGRQYPFFQSAKPALAPQLDRLIRQVYQKALQLAPNDKRLIDGFTWFHIFEATATKDSALKVKLLEEGLAYARDPMIRQQCLERLAEAHFGAGGLSAARRDAGELLQLASMMPQTGLYSANYATATHTAEIVLGRVALQEGNVPEAGARLLESAKVPGSPTLNSFGPDWNLARDLMKQGGRDVVLQYIELCGAFWETGKKKLRIWAATIRDGGTPDFRIH